MQILPSSSVSPLSLLQSCRLFSVSPVSLLPILLCSPVCSVSRNVLVCAIHWKSIACILYASYTVCCFLWRSNNQSNTICRLIFSLPPRPFLWSCLTILQHLPFPLFLSMTIVFHFFHLFPSRYLAHLFHYAYSPDSLVKFFKRMGLCNALKINNLQNYILQYTAYCFIIDWFSGYYRTSTKTCPAHSFAYLSFLPCSSLLLPFIVFFSVSFIFLPPPQCRELHLSSDEVRHLTLSQRLVSWEIFKKRSVLRNLTQLIFIFQNTQKALSPTVTENIIIWGAEWMPDAFFHTK